MTEEQSGGDLSRLRQLNALGSDPGTARRSAADADRAGQADRPVPRLDRGRGPRTGRARLGGRGRTGRPAPSAGPLAATGSPPTPAGCSASTSAATRSAPWSPTSTARCCELTVLERDARARPPGAAGRHRRVRRRGAWRSAGTTPDQIWSTGVATTGLVDGTGKVMLSDSLTEWTGVDLAAHLRRQVAGPGQGRERQQAGRAGRVLAWGRPVRQGRGVPAGRPADRYRPDHRRQAASRVRQRRR